MQWASVGEFFSMGGRGFYVWGSYLVTAAVMIGELIALSRRRRASRALQAARRQA